ncbi:hypothetical protein AUEXF2481DRAFT_206772 [Aureobasidium subglaciale EXF-2481]|uniref:Uncharacterized protein n=1 Tax=Aureobasidium subglaciale (strain EXF-2481) TaxID=1043005 RepID=A0A074Z0T0_AURSE|nr:uncharacterized protein AUEXF2481DRAFT_206772 [Aureobasidium subglaciale EXF-2481]KAI5211454.1 hypothetical protein E4T38_01354 [Aureobasidium subglaciale]KAI5229718.1 hypothetical protein E4T40_01355 [Aureobasidium subglaciale]KAI5233457.1 hypothetical protein E4T41_01353 [Aureobasidium subglaciale]KAI5266540.1 hypothetical protein E4T46_01354 [Aureobasidium subglaciale]KEQ99977.1 hypothetical protein AUEXF2481DRAFT_206772 [Aureobasidium subglaciale EXF-2481]
MLNNRPYSDIPPACQDQPLGCADESPARNTKVRPSPHSGYFTAGSNDTFHMMADFRGYEIDDCETIGASFTGIMTPGSTVFGLEIPKPTVVIRVRVTYKYGKTRERLEIKMRRDMPFKELVSLFKNRHAGCERFLFQYVTWSELDKPKSQRRYRLIFETDTPACLDLADIAELEFVWPGDTKAMDLSQV